MDFYSLLQSNHIKLSLVSLQESLNQKQAEYTEDELFFHTENKMVVFFLETTPEEYLILSDPIHTDDHQKIIQALCRHIGYCNAHALNAGHPYGAMLDVADLRKIIWIPMLIFSQKL